MSICAHCGGSGIQRINDQRFRTCLPCLGQGGFQVEAALEGAQLICTPIEPSQDLPVTPSLSSSR
ncbi:MAG: hypothetical protein AB8E74_04575 [Prochlorococcus sp.]|nr:hypothetical protein [Prochlorococcaceae cyanobacterium Fu_MAG_50]